MSNFQQHLQPFIPESYIANESVQKRGIHRHAP